MTFGQVTKKSIVKKAGWQGLGILKHVGAKRPIFLEECSFFSIFLEALARISHKKISTNINSRYTRKVGSYRSSRL